MRVKYLVHVINKVDVEDPNNGEGALSSHENLLEFTLQKDFLLLQNFEESTTKFNLETLFGESVWIIMTS